MTDKQIIVTFSDGYCIVLEDNKVSIRENEFTKLCIVVGNRTNELLEFVKNIYLDNKRKEQECEELKKQYNCYACDTCKGKEDYINLKRHCENAIKSLHNKQAKLDQLKAENEKYSLFIEKLCDYAGLECDDEEQAMRTLSDLASQMNKARWIIDRYKQTLTEIKEITEGNCKLCLSVDGFKEPDDCGICEYARILQKISECEGNDGTKL